MFRSVLFAVAMSTCLASGSALAQQDLSSEEEQARALFEAGRTAFEAGRFDQALRYFDESYELSRRPALLFNIASAADRLQRNQRALESYRAYLEAVPNASNRELAESRVRFLEGVLSGGGERGSEAVGDGTLGQVTLGEGTLDEGARRGPAPVGADITSEAWFWTLIAVLVVGAGVGVTAGIVAGTSGTQEPLTGDVPVFTAIVEW